MLNVRIVARLWIWIIFPKHESSSLLDRSAPSFSYWAAASIPSMQATCKCSMQRWQSAQKKVIFAAVLFVCKSVSDNECARVRRCWWLHGCCVKQSREAERYGHAMSRHIVQANLQTSFCNDALLDSTIVMPAELRIQACAATTRSSACISVIPHVEGRVPSPVHECWYISFWSYIQINSVA